MLSLCSTVPPHTDRTHCGRQKPSIWITELRNRGTNPYYTNSLDDLKQSLKLDPKYIKACMIGCAWRERFLACITKLSLLCWWALPHINNQRSSPVAVIQQHTAAYHLWSFQSPSSPNQVTRSWRKSMHWGSVQFWAAGSVQAWARLGQLHTMASEAHRRPLWTFSIFASQEVQTRIRTGTKLVFTFNAHALLIHLLGILGATQNDLMGRLSGVFCFCFFIATMAEIPSPSSPKLWQRMTTGWRWTHSAEGLVLASSQRHGYRTPFLTWLWLSAAILAMLHRLISMINTFRGPPLQQFKDDFSII